METLSSILTIVVNILGFMIGLSILVVIHEFGHFYPAKLFGMRVEKFYLFFDWPRKLWSIIWRGTEYGIGLLPLGGYVKITGMIDESLDTKEAGAAPEPWEFRAKPVWQRLIVMAGGVTMNVIFGVLVFSLIMHIYGQEKIEMSQVNRQGIHVRDGSVADALGFETGDKVVKFNGQPIEYLNEVSNPRVLLEEQAQFEIIRDGQRQTIDIPPDYINTFADRPDRDMPLFGMRLPMRIDSVVTNTAAAKAGLEPGAELLRLGPAEINSFNDLRDFIANHNRLIVEVRRDDSPAFGIIPLDSTLKTGIESMDEEGYISVRENSPADQGELQTGDQIIEINGQSIQNMDEFQAYVQNYGKQRQELVYKLAGDTLNKMVNLPQGEPLGVINGFRPPVVRKKYSLLGAFIPGTQAAFGVIVDNIKGFRKVFTGNADFRKSVSGPIRIYSFYQNTVDELGWLGHWQFIAMLSMVLAFINILPFIPVLDGGHIFFLLIEWIRGKALPAQTQIAIMQVGLIMLIALTLFVFYNDIVSLG